MMGAALGAAATTALPGAVAAAPRIPIGAACNHYVLGTDQAYRAALARHVDVIVPEGAMKWDYIRPKPDAFDFEPAAPTAAFARLNGLQLRGHTLVWCTPKPGWLNALGSEAETAREMERHIPRVMGHYRGQVRSWDVVNEPIAEKPTSDRDLRQGVWLRHLGDRYIDRAFRIAADVDPAGERVLNEYGVEATRPQDKIKRQGFLRLIRELKDRGVPLTAIGLQGHLHGDLVIDTDGVSRFCQEVARMGLDVLVTELDVIDDKLPGDIAERDRLVARRAEQFLGAVFAGARPKLVCTWGISDRYTWVPTWFKRADGQKNRSLPLDHDMNVKPFWHVLQRFCRGA